LESQENFLNSEDVRLPSSGGFVHFPHLPKLPPVATGSHGSMEISIEVIVSQQSMRYTEPESSYVFMSEESLQAPYCDEADVSPSGATSGGQMPPCYATDTGVSKMSGRCLH
jgi:hypothetical protein